MPTTMSLLIKGKHGHGLIDDLLLGAVARGFVQNYPVPVLFVSSLKRLHFFFFVQPSFSFLG